ncbi:MAG: AAA family ATPase, partial [Moorella sp. (in: Bacteria)]|nr:AAA family ATPase [Moorella sp. (in: firmicutes)]
AGILAVRPEVLVLDEPTAGLDPRGRRRLIGLFKDLQRRQGKTIILITHQMDVAAELADRVIVLCQGRIFRQGSPREVFADAGALQEIGLKPPLPVELLSRLGIPEVALTLTEAEMKIKKRRPNF